MNLTLYSSHLFIFLDLKLIIIFNYISIIAQ